MRIIKIMFLSSILLSHSFASDNMQLKEKCFAGDQEACDALDKSSGIGKKTILPEEEAQKEKTNKVNKLKPISSSQIPVSTQSSLLALSQQEQDSYNKLASLQQEIAPEVCIFQQTRKIKRLIGKERALKQKELLKECECKAYKKLPTVQTQVKKILSAHPLWRGRTVKCCGVKPTRSLDLKAFEKLEVKILSQANNCQ